MIEKLDEATRAEVLPALLDNGWSIADGRDAIEKRFAFKDFVDAFGWMTQVAIWSEKWNHHPEWMNVYRTVTVTLSTHDVSGLTELDIQLARKMDELG